MFIAALFLTVKKVKQSKCLQLNDQQIQYIYTVKTIHTKGTSNWYLLQDKWASEMSS